MQLNKSYMEFCKSALIPPVGILELSNMCRVLNDQVLDRYFISLINYITTNCSKKKLLKHHFVCTAGATQIGSISRREIQKSDPKSGWSRHRFCIAGTDIKNKPSPRSASYVCSTIFCSLLAFCLFIYDFLFLWSRESVFSETAFSKFFKSRVLILFMLDFGGFCFQVLHPLQLQG